MPFSINISSLPNQRQMRVWHLSGLKTVQRKRNVLKHPVYVKLYLTFSYLAQLVILVMTL